MAGGHRSWHTPRAQPTTGCSPCPVLGTFRPEAGYLAARPLALDRTQGCPETTRKGRRGPGQLPEWSQRGPCHPPRRGRMAGPRPTGVLVRVRCQARPLLWGPRPWRMAQDPRAQSLLGDTMKRAPCLLSGARAGGGRPRKRPVWGSWHKRLEAGRGDPHCSALASHAPCPSACSRPWGDSLSEAGRSWGAGPGPCTALGLPQAAAWPRAEWGTPFRTTEGQEEAGEREARDVRVGPGLLPFITEPLGSLAVGRLLGPRG